MTYIPALRNVESTLNSTTTPLGSNGVFTGTIEDALYYTQIEVCVFSDVDSAPLGMSLQFSDVNSATVFNNPITQGAIHIKDSVTSNSYYYKKYEAISRYFRIVYTNGSSSQSVFRLKVILSSDQKQSESSFGFNSNIEIPTDNTIDMFGRQRTSDPYTLFDSKLLTTSDRTNWSRLNTTGQAEATSFVYNTQQPYMKLYMGSGITGKIVSQSRKYVPYVPGKSTLVLVTGSLITRSGSTASQATTRIGYFDDKVDKTNGSEIATGDGLFFQCVDSTDGTGNNFTLSIVERSSIDEGSPANPTQTDTVIPQASWNNDPLDGSGPSGFTFDPRQKSLFFFNFEWLGVGIASVGIVLKGKFVTCHVFSHMNTGPLPYITRPSLPIRYEISRATNVAVAVNLTRVCSTVISEGGFNPVGFPYVATSQQNGKPTGNVSTGTELPVLAIRTKIARPRVTSIIQTCNIYTQASTNANGTYLARLYRIFGSTGASPITGGSWVSADADSAIDYNNNMTSFSLAGLRYVVVYEQHYGVGKAFTVENNSFGTKIDCISDINGNPDFFLLTTTTINSSASGDVSYGNITWYEYE